MWLQLRKQERCSGTGEWLCVQQDEKNIKYIRNGEKTACFGAFLSPAPSLSPLHCINTNVRYVNDLYMYAKLSPTICFNCLCRHWHCSVKTRAFPRLPSTSVLTNAAVSVHVCGAGCVCGYIWARVRACVKVRVCPRKNIEDGGKVSTLNFLSFFLSSNG